MKIAFLLSSVSQSGGMERVCIKIANELSKHHNVTIINLHGPTKPFFEVNNNVNIYFLDEKKIPLRKKFIKRIFKLRKILRKEKFDFLIDVDSYLSFISTPATFGLDIKTIAWEHFNVSVDFSRKSRTIARKLATRKNHVVTLTEKDKEAYEKLTGKKNIIVISNPVPFDLPVVPTELKEKRIISVGRLSYQKGYDFLLKAWALIYKEIPDWKLQIIGDGELKDELLALHKELNLGNSLEFVGRTNNVEQYYQNCSLLVMSSRFEGLPMVLIESKFYGLPQISFDCETGPIEIIENGVDGFLVEPENIEQLAEKILYAINNNLLKEFSENALKNTDKFKIETIIKQWEGLFKKTEDKQ